MIIYLRVRPRELSKDRDQLFLLHLALIVNVLVFDNARFEDLAKALPEGYITLKDEVTNGLLWTATGNAWKISKASSLGSRLSI